jgi:hypothetical protein
VFRPVHHHAENETIAAISEPAMSALATLKAARAAGIELTLDGEDLVLEAPSPPPRAVLDLLARHKVRIVQLLRPAKVDGSIGHSERLFEQRAGIIEYDRLAPRIWAEALARLDPAQPPGDVPPKRWRRFIDDCGNFLDQDWAHRAAELGWTPFGLFGCDRSKPFARIDKYGLLWLLEGRQVRVLTRDIAVINTANGRSVTFYRCERVTGQVLAWEFAP